MRLIKLFEQFVSEESEDASMTTSPASPAVAVSNAVLTPQSLLDNKSTEYNRALGVLKKDLPKSMLASLGDYNYDGMVDRTEMNALVNSLDYPMDSDAPNQWVSWIQGKGLPGLDYAKPALWMIPLIALFGSGGPYKLPKIPLKYRAYFDSPSHMSYDKDYGLFYPAVEDLRVSYNRDESFETLGSAVSKPELAEVKKLLLECYQYWISSINSSKFNPPMDDPYFNGDFMGDFKPKPTPK